MKVEWTVTAMAMAMATAMAMETETVTPAEVVPAAVALRLAEVVPAAVAPLLAAVRPPEVRSDPEGERLPAEWLQAGRQRQVGPSLQVERWVRGEDLPSQGERRTLEEPPLLEEPPHRAAAIVSLGAASATPPETYHPSVIASPIRGARTIS
jgi:hypothetical protein